MLTPNTYRKMFTPWIQKTYSWPLCHRSTWRISSERQMRSPNWREKRGGGNELLSDWILSSPKNDSFSKEFLMYNFTSYAWFMLIQSGGVSTYPLGTENYFLASGKTTFEQNWERFGGHLAMRGLKNKLIMGITLKWNHPWARRAPAWDSVL